MIIGGDWIPGNLGCEACGRKSQVTVTVNRMGSICADCVADVLGQFIKASGLDPADTTLLEFLVKFGHGEMPEETSLQTVLDHLWAKVKQASPATTPNAPKPDPVLEITPLNWSEKDILSGHHDEWCDLSVSELEFHMSPGWDQTCKRHRVVLLTGNRVAMANPKNPDVLYAVSVRMSNFRAVRAHPRQISDALKLLGIE